MIKNKGIFKVSFLLKILFFLGLSSNTVFSQTPPVAVYDVATADINTTLNVPSGAPDNYTNLLDNDVDADGDALTITRFSIDGGISWINAGNSGAVPQGVITINANGTYTFVPNAGVTGIVNNIIYEISDGTDTTTTTLYLTIETNEDIIEISNVASCNQGFTADGLYKIRYNVTVKNISTTRGYHKFSEVDNIQIFDDLNAVFGDCITLIDNKNMGVAPVSDFLGATYPIDWSPVDIINNTEFHEDDPTPGAQGVLINTPSKKLYPKQSMSIEFCVYIDPFCGNPTPSGSGIDFNNIINLTSSRGNDTNNLIITDFHTAETTVAANLFIPGLVGSVSDPTVEPDLTYVYSNRVIIKNDGNAVANNVNYNMGLGNFLDNGIAFSLNITQVSGPAVTINTLYNGDDKSLLLTNGNSLNAGEVVILDIAYVVSPTPSSSTVSFFTNLVTSMSQGAIDGQGQTAPIVGDDEFSPANRRVYSYVIWDDAQGNHLDRYYVADTDTAEPSSNSQCQCATIGMRFMYDFTVSSSKELFAVNPAPNGILEQKELTFKITIRNTSSNAQTVNLQIEDNISNICPNSIVSVGMPTIISSTATTDPMLNASFNGVTDLNIFDGTSGVLDPPPNPNATNPDYQEVTVEYKVIIKDDCNGVNTATFIAEDTLGNSTSVLDTANVTIFTDSDGDGITNLNDIDDDNDGIPDIVEYNGLDPLDDDDTDHIPNYRDIDFGADTNNDGIVDLFDFDMDGIPNHFDLDSDNDGIMDIVEAGGLDPDNNGLVPISNTGTLLLDDDADGLSDSLVVDTTGDSIADTSVDVDVVGGIPIPNSDSDNDTHPNALDLDSDNDGIVDNIEAQPSDNYMAPSAVNTNGTVYTNGLEPIDTEEDNVPDYLDTNSENDYRDDIIEAWDTNNDGVPETNISNIDNDNDGLDDAFDNDTNAVNPTNNGQLATDFPNVDNDTTPELDWRELPAILLIINPDHTVIEGNDLIFTLSLVALNDHSILRTSTTEVTVDVYTSDGTATTSTYDVAISPYDYIGIASTSPDAKTIAVGTSEISIRITTNDDNVDELDELMTFNVVTTSGNTINPATNTMEVGIELKSIGTIQDNDDAPDITMTNTIEEEGVDLVPVITLSHPSSTPVVIDLVTTDGTAVSPDDYTSYVNTLTIDGTIDPANPNVAIDFHIVTIEDGVNEPNIENLQVDGVVTSGTVLNQDLNKIGEIKDKQPSPFVVISNPTVVEGNILAFVISLEDPTTNEPLSNFEDINLNIFTIDGEAREPDDYLKIDTQIVIPAYTTEKVVQVMTNDDELVEDLETLTLKGIITTFNTDNIDAEGVGTIIDNDLPNLFSPNNDGLSDVFELVSLEQYVNFKLQIFDRWGSEVYNYENKSNPQPVWWDGTMKGNPVPEGVYYYTIDYNDGITEPKSGFIQLIR